MKLLHPFMPFVTEAVWQRLPKAGSAAPSLMVSPWVSFPSASSNRDEQAEGWFRRLCSLVTAVRNARAEQGIPPKERLPLTIYCGDAAFQAAIGSEAAALAYLAKSNADLIEARPLSQRPKEIPASTIRIVVNEELEVDMLVPRKAVDVEKELQRLQKQFNQVCSQLEGLDKKITPQFLEKCDPEAREKITQKRNEYSIQKASLAAQLEELGTSEAESGSKTRRTVLAGVLAGVFLLGGVHPVSAGVGEGDTLPDGARQEDRIRKALDAWKKLRDKLEGLETVSKEEWENTQGFLRRLYGINDDMSFLVKNFTAEKKQQASELITKFKKKVKASDKPAKAKDLPAFLEMHTEITKMIEDFTLSLFDANEDVSGDAGEEEDLDINAVPPS